MVPSTNYMIIRGFDTANIPVVLLAGGRGTRLAEMTHEIPKPMVPIGEYPMLVHIMRYYGSYGFRRFIVCLGYLGRVVKEYFLNIDRNTANLSFKGDEPRFARSFISEWEIELVETGADTLTGSRLARVADLLHEPMFCLTYGDGVTDLPLDRELEFHLSHGRIGTVGAVHPPSRFGNLQLGSNGEVQSFREKAPLQHDFINGGYFIFQREFLKYVTAEQNESLESRPLEQLASAGELFAFGHSGFWQCMDTMRDVESLRSLCERGQAPWLRRSVE